MSWFNTDMTWPLELSLLAGLSTSIGGLLAIMVKPSQANIATMLGTAIGVMATVSVVELLVDNAIHNDFFLVSAMFAAGAAFYWIIQPFFPHLDEQPVAKVSDNAWNGQGKRGDQPNGQSILRQSSRDDVEESASQAEIRHNTANLMRLGLVMAFTMTMHNLPEGFAVAFSAYTEFGPLMAIVIALHNIPEGIIIAGPIYAATGSRWKAMAMATASGLSEPLGALLALVLLRPYFTAERLQYLLSFVGGVMLAVCCIELYPEGRACHHDRQLVYGIIAGTLVMGFTLYLH